MVGHLFFIDRRTMNELEATNEFINNAIRNSSYHSVVISSCVFIAYTLIIKVFELFKANNRNKPIIEMGKAVTEVSNNVVKLNSILDKFFKDNERKEVDKAKRTIELVFIGYKNNIEHLCRDIIIHNNINENKELIVSNITQTVNAEYYKMYAILNLYYVNDKTVSLQLKESWIEDTVQDVITIIYNNQDNQTRVSQIVNKLSVKMNNYSTYVYNKTFND